LQLKPDAQHKIQDQQRLVSPRGRGCGIWAPKTHSDFSFFDEYETKSKRVF